MHPTTEEHLAAVRRLLDDVGTDPGLSGSSRQALDEAARRLRRIERSGAARLPFLVWDNRASRALLAELAGLGPGPAAVAAEAAGDAMAGDERAEHHEPTAHELNKRQRERLARAVDQVPDGPAGDGWRSRLADHLRARTGADPAINRPPRSTAPRPTDDQRGDPADDR